MASAISFIGAEAYFSAPCRLRALACPRQFTEESLGMIPDSAA